jgi:antitoxin VapB
VPVARMRTCRYRVFGKELFRDCQCALRGPRQAPAILDIWSIYRREEPLALSLKDLEADRLAREVAARTGETLTTAVVVALRERLSLNCGAGPKRRRLRDQPREIAQRCAQLPTLDDRSGDEILGYDDRGLPR